MVARVNARTFFHLICFAGAAAAGCTRTPAPVEDFASLIIVHGTVRDSLGTPLHAAPVAAVGYSSATCSGFAWSTDSTVTDSLGHYSCRLSNFGRPQSVKTTARAPAGLTRTPGTSCRADLDLEGPAWRDTIVVDLSLGGP